MSKRLLEDEEEDDDNEDDEEEDDDDNWGIETVVLTTSCSVQIHNSNAM